MKKRFFRKVLIIADDFTGANDTVAQFAKLALPSVTVIRSSACTSSYLRSLADEYDVIAINTDSRALDPREAYKAIYSLFEKINEAFDEAEDLLIYKKIDSTLRGNITAELQAVYDSFKPQLISFAPAYPKQGRTTLNGIHLVNGVPVDQTQFAKDPRNPVKSSYIPSYFEDVFKEKYKHITIDELRSDKASDMIERYEVLSFDIENDNDLKTLVNCVLRTDKKVIWVGSAGLAEHLAYTTIVGRTRGKPVLVAIGTLNNVTRIQVSELTKALNCKLLLINLKSLLDDPELEYKRLKDDIEVGLKESSEIILTTSYTQEQVKDGELLANEMGIGLSQLGALIAKNMGELINMIVSDYGIERFSGIFASGGDIALAIINKLNIDFVSVIGEIEPGLPLLKHKNSYIVTKAGGFGKEDTLIKTVVRIKSLARRHE